MLLPSWVPNWSRRHEKPRILQDPTIEKSGSHSPFKAAKGFRHNTRLYPSQAGILHVAGRIIDLLELRTSNPVTFVLELLFRSSGRSPIAKAPFIFLTDEQVKTIYNEALADQRQNLMERLASVIVAGHVHAGFILAKYDSEHGFGVSSDQDQFLNQQLGRMNYHHLWHPIEEFGPHPAHRR